MSITLPTQINGQTADATFINDLANAVEAHDAALEAMGADIHGPGKYHTTANTKATTASTTEVAITDYQLSALDIPAGRMVEFVARLRMSSTIANDVALVRLRQTNVSGTLAGEERIVLPVATIQQERTLILPWRSSGGAITWLLTVHRLAGTGTITVTTGGATLPGIFYARDVVADAAFTIV